ncbi:hypothetical protein [Methylobacterium sp. Leaf118]|nr:hypothetical protein [Methylobacterium sp. Leaf118]
MDHLALAIMASATAFSGFVVLLGWRWNFSAGMRRGPGGLSH